MTPSIVQVSTKKVLMALATIKKFPLGCPPAVLTTSAYHRYSALTSLKKNLHYKALVVQHQGFDRQLITPPKNCLISLVGVLIEQ